MIEKHQYESNLAFGAINFNLIDLRAELLNYLEKNTLAFSKYMAEDAPHFLYGFHSKGISIQVQETRGTEASNPKFIDVTLFSEITSTLSLEERLRDISEKYKKKEGEK
jgi:hypothetical protein